MLKRSVKISLTLEIKSLCITCPCNYLFQATKYTFLGINVHVSFLCLCSIINNATSGFSLSCTAIGNAFAVLSDPEKRRRYDQFGDENPQPRIYRDHYDYARGFEG